MIRRVHEHVGEHLFDRVFEGLALGVRVRETGGEVGIAGEKTTPIRGVLRQLGGALIARERWPDDKWARFARQTRQPCAVRTGEMPEDGERAGRWDVGQCRDRSLIRPRVVVEQTREVHSTMIVPCIPSDWCGRQ